MGAEAILEKIRKNAEEEAAALAKQGEEKAEAAAGKIRADAEAEAAAILGNARQRAEELEKRERLMAGLQIRKNTLAARRAVMDEAFSLAGEQLADLPKERWEALITRLLLEAAETGAEIMEVPAADREKYEWTPEGNLPIIGEKSFFKRLNAALKESGREGKLTLGDAPANVTGGFRLMGPVYDVDASFDALLSQAREDWEQEIYRILYPKDE